MGTDQEESFKAWLDRERERTASAESRGYRRALWMVAAGACMSLWQWSSMIHRFECGERDLTIFDGNKTHVRMALSALASLGDEGARRMLKGGGQ